MSKTEIEYIEYEGIVTSVDATRKVVKVRLTDPEEVGGEKTPEEVKVYTDKAAGYQSGEKVTVRQSMRLHPRTLSTMAIIVSVVLIAGMLGAFLLTGSNTTALISGLGVMMFSFAFISMMRERMPHEFVYHIIE